MFRQSGDTGKPSPVCVAWYLYPGSPTLVRYTQRLVTGIILGPPQLLYARGVDNILGRSLAVGYYPVWLPLGARNTSYSPRPLDNEDGLIF